MTYYTGLQYSDTNSATLAGLKQKIYFDCKCNSLSISDGDMNRIINTYYAQVQAVIRSVNENFYMAIATTDLVIGDGSYSFPDGTGTAPPYEKISSIWAAFQPANPASPLVSEFQRVDIIDPDSISDPAYTFSPDSAKAQIFGTYFVLEPLVTDVTKYPVTNGVKMYYIATQNTLTNNTDVPLIFPGFHDVIALGAEIDVFHRLGNDEDCENAKIAFKKRLDEVASYASAHVPPELGVVEGQDELGGWAYPFGFNSMA